MRPYFTDLDAWAAAIASLEAWLGTPYRHMTAVRGRGADCTLFIGAWLMELGILTRVQHGYYAKDWYDHAADDILVDALYRHFAESCWPGFALAAASMPLQVGDILGFSTRRPGITNHVGILVEPSVMIHSVEGRGVSRYQFGDCWKRRLRHAFRVMVEE